MLNMLVSPTATTADRPSTSSRFVALANSVVRSVWAWHRRRLTIRRLQELDDRSLRDIGLDRSEIGSVVYGGGHRRNPSWTHIDIYGVGR
jgi:uncharacterized protein YjiS (DUF1127 family)